MEPALQMLLSDMRTEQRAQGEKIDKLLAFKWQIMGMTALGSFTVGIIVQVIIALVSAKHGG